MTIWSGILQEHTRPSTLRRHAHGDERDTLQAIRGDIPEFTHVPDGVVLSIWEDFCQDNFCAALLPWQSRYVAQLRAHAASVLPLSQQEISKVLGGDRSRFVMVALDDQERVLAACIVGYEEEHTFRLEHGGKVLIVPGPITLGQSLTPEQHRAAVTNLQEALNELALWRSGPHLKTPLPEGTQLLSIHKNGSSYSLKAICYRKHRVVEVILQENLSREEAQREHGKRSREISSQESKVSIVAAKTLQTGHILWLEQTGRFHVVERVCGEDGTEDRPVRLLLTPPIPEQLQLDLPPTQDVIVLA